MLQAGLDWLDARSGYRQLLEALAQTPLPGGARWGRTLFPLVLGLVGLEALTGVGLTAWYAPTTTDAWASVNHVQSQLALGWLLRGLHQVGGTALVVVAVLHLLQLVLWAGYRAPRELSWLCLVVALQALIVTSHTGYLLPWDLRAYWATQVLVGIAGNQPLVGGAARLLIQGGAEVGNTTLTHLYALHVVLGPAALVGLLGAGWLLGRRAGAVPAGPSPTGGTPPAEPWVARQAVYDFAAVFVVLVGLVAYVAATGGVPLDAPGDPAADYVARPEWYFLPVFTLRHFFTGQWEFLATSAAPGLATAFLAALPFVYARLEKQGRSPRRLLAATTGLGLLAAVGLGVYQAALDGADPKARAIEAKAEAAAKLAQRLAAKGVPVEGPLLLFQNDPLVWGERVFLRDCAGCHEPCDKSPYEGALCLEGYGGRAWLEALLVNPAARHFFGNTKLDAMDAFTGSDDARAAIVEFLYAEAGFAGADPALAKQGRKAYDDEGCESCHSLDGQGTGDAADLKGWATPEWLAAFIRTPDAVRFYGEANEMDAFGHDTLTNRELAAVIAYLRTLEARPAQFDPRPVVDSPAPRKTKENPAP